MPHWPSLLAGCLVFVAAYACGWRARTFWIAGFVATLLGVAATLASPNGDTPKHRGYLTWNSPAPALGAAFWTAAVGCAMAASGLRRTHDEPHAS